MKKEKQEKDMKMLTTAYGFERKNAPNETRQIEFELESYSDSERVCFRDHSQKTNVYTRQFVPETISSQGVLFQGRQ